ncbi:nucleotidyltransferase [Clostridium sp.]|uniref:nucleotidyltransferase n=1 Tax=Clostridium sp. TaxID=1506 RepID=UPI003F2C7907
MNITGIITEYNPFHKGHFYHLTSAKESTKADGIVCIMSGNFIQRGGPAILDKWKRAEMAIDNGVDLVIELPTFYALSSAEYFAKGAISILDKLGVVNTIFFGSESGNISDLKNISSLLSNEPDDYKNLLKDNLSKGLTFAKARELSLKEYFSINSSFEVDDILNNSNNILGIEYIKALLTLNSKIEPLTLKREGSNYNDKSLNNTFSSATSIRETLKNNSELESIYKDLPENSFKIFKKLYDNNYEFIFENHMFNMIKYKLVVNCVNFNNLSEVSEGLDNKLLKEIYRSTSFEDLVFRVKSKRYTYTKISRILTQIFIGFDLYNKDDLINPDNLYCRVLGFNSKGKDILKEIKKRSSIPLITKIPKHINNDLLKLDIQATKCYSLLNNSVDPFSDHLLKPIIK